jgi:hypothetical protein
MRRALLLCAVACIALSAVACGPSFWSEIKYYDGHRRLERPLPDYLVGRSQAWVLEHLGEPDQIGTPTGGTFESGESWLYRDRDFDLLVLQADDRNARHDSLLTSHIPDTRFVRSIELVIEGGTVAAVKGVSYRHGAPNADDESLASVFHDRDKPWVLGQLGPPDVILPRMAGDTFVYRNRSIDLWVLRVRPTIVNNPAIYTRAEGNRYIQRLNVYFDKEGHVRNVSFPLEGNTP